MEICKGDDLYNYLHKRQFVLPENRAAELIRQLSTSLYYINNFGMVHRDIKPENILMTDHTNNAELKLLDFGLSRILGNNETLTELAGTLVYNQV